MVDGLQQRVQDRCMQERQKHLQQKQQHLLVMRDGSVKSGEIAAMVRELEPVLTKIIVELRIICQERQQHVLLKNQQQARQ